MKRAAIPLVGLIALFGASSAQASITLGQLAPDGATPQNCGPSSGAFVQPSVTSGPSYVVPTGGRITSWTTLTNSTSGQQLGLMILRPLGGDSYLAVAHDGQRPLTPSALNRFSVNIAVQPGDILGLDSSFTEFPTTCGFEVPGETGERATGAVTPPADGETGTFVPNDGKRINITAEFEPSNAFSLAGTTRNKKKGTATITVSLPGPGSISVSGNGLKPQQASLATPTGGNVSVLVVATGKVAKKLRKRGKAGVSPTVTFTPTGGAAASQSESLKLLRKKPRKKK